MVRVPRRLGTLSLLLLPLALAASAPSPAQAQDLRYTTVSDVAFGGALGRVMGAMPGMDTEVRETTWISGARMRTDSENTSTIVDLEAGRFTGLDHEARQYWVFDMGDLSRSMQGMREAAEGMEEARVEAGPQRARAGSDDAARRMDIRVSTDRTGDTREISGFDAERVFVTIEIETEGTVASEEGEETEVNEGTMVLLNELWLTRENLMAIPEGLDVEGYREMTADAMDDWAAMEQAFASDPELQVAFDRSRAALDDLEGTALESTLFWVLVPPDMDFDREAALADRDRSLSDDLAAAAKESAAESAKNAVKSRLGGLFGGGKKDEEPEEEQEPELAQQTFLRVRTLLEEVDRAAIPASTFQVPEGYTERQLPTGGGTGGR